MEPLTLTGLTNAVLTQGITFLYSQAGEILRGRRTRLKGRTLGFRYSPSLRRL